MSNARTVEEHIALSVVEAGRYLGVSADTIRRLIRAGTLPHARIGNSIRLRRSDLAAYLDAQTTREWKPVDGRGRKS
ncbi:MAG: helix-turn-helix domain-containing protein [Pirellulaceae bacterium]|nr:helix-turn-helix domain-containing protein [Pirellulaceae bacterium]